MASKLTDEHVTKFRDMYEAGASWLAMGNELDVDPSWLAVWRARLDIPLRKVKSSRVQWTDAMIAELRVLAPISKPYAIGKRLGISKDAVKSQLGRMGLNLPAPAPVDTYTGSPRWFRDQFGPEPLPVGHPIAAAVLGLAP